jgi:hypothetical protein
VIVTDVMSRTVAVRDIDLIDNPQMKDLYRAWTEIARSRLPCAADFPPGCIEPMLPNLALAEMSNAGPVYRFFGPALVRLLGRDPTGSRVETVYPGAIARDVLDAMARVRKDGSPLLHARQFRILSRELGYNRLLLPLFETGDAVTHIIVCIQPSSPHVRAAADWLQAVRSLRRHNEPLLNARRTWKRLQDASPVHRPGGWSPRVIPAEPTVGS